MNTGNIESWKILLDVCVLAASVFAAWNSLSTKFEIARMKLWIMKNFQPRAKPMLMDDTMDT